MTNNLKHRINNVLVVGFSGSALLDSFYSQTSNAHSTTLFQDRPVVSLNLPMGPPDSSGYFTSCLLARYSQSFKTQENSETEDLKPQDFGLRDSTRAQAVSRTRNILLKDRKITRTVSMRSSVTVKSAA